jgi:hypothetical protein
MGWRYQIPMLVNMGLRVVAPDCLGYGRTVCKAPYAATNQPTHTPNAMTTDIKNRTPQPTHFLTGTKAAQQI